MSMLYSEKNKHCVCIPYDYSAIPVYSPIPVYSTIQVYNAI